LGHLLELRLHFGLGGFAFLVEVEEHVEVVNGLFGGLVVVGPDLDALQFLERGLGFLGVVPEAGGLALLFQVSYLGFAVIVVKGTSSRPPHGLSGLSLGQQSFCAKG
jgi:hypothetical protein